MVGPYTEAEINKLRSIERNTVGQHPDTELMHWSQNMVEMQKTQRS